MALPSPLTPQISSSTSHNPISNKAPFTTSSTASASNLNINNSSGSIDVNMSNGATTANSADSPSPASDSSSMASKQRKKLEDAKVVDGLINDFNGVTAITNSTASSTNTSANTSAANKNLEFKRLESGAILITTNSKSSILLGCPPRTISSTFTPPSSSLSSTDSTTPPPPLQLLPSTFLCAQQNVHMRIGNNMGILVNDVHAYVKGYLRQVRSDTIKSDNKCTDNKCTIVCVNSQMATALASLFNDNDYEYEPFDYMTAYKPVCGFQKEKGLVRRSLNALNTEDGGKDGGKDGGENKEKVDWKSLIQFRYIGDAQSVVDGGVIVPSHSNSNAGGDDSESESESIIITLNDDDNMYTLTTRKTNESVTMSTKVTLPVIPLCVRDVIDINPVLFVPPVFGVTFINDDFINAKRNEIKRNGNVNSNNNTSTESDQIPTGYTGSYIIWLNHHGILVNPTPYISLIMHHLYGISDGMIKCVIVTRFIDGLIDIDTDIDVNTVSDEGSPNGLLNCALFGCRRTVHTTVSIYNVYKRYYDLLLPPLADTGTGTGTGTRSRKNSTSSSSSQPHSQALSESRSRTPTHSTLPKVNEPIPHELLFRPIQINLPIHICGGTFTFFYNLAEGGDEGGELGFKCMLGESSLGFVGGYSFDGNVVEGCFAGDGGDDGEKEKEKKVNRLAYIQSIQSLTADCSEVFYTLPSSSSSSRARATSSILVASMSTNLPPTLLSKIRLTNPPSTTTTPLPHQLTQSNSLNKPDPTTHTLIYTCASLKYSLATNTLQALSSLPFYAKLPIEKASHVVEVCRKKVYAAGEVLCRRGEVGGIVGVVFSGVVGVYECDFDDVGKYEDEHKMMMKPPLLPSDNFNIPSILNLPSSVTLVCKTQVIVVCVDTGDMHEIVGGTDVVTKLGKMCDVKTVGLFDLLKDNMALRYGIYGDGGEENKCVGLNYNEVTAIEACSTLHVVEGGGVVWRKGDDSRFACIIVEGELMIECDVAAANANDDNEDSKQTITTTLKKSAIIGNLTHPSAPSSQTKCTSTLTNASPNKCTYLKLDVDGIRKLRGLYPGLSVGLSDGEWFV